MPNSSNQKPQLSPFQQAAMNISGVMAPLEHFSGVCIGVANSAETSRGDILSLYKMADAINNLLIAFGELKHVFK